MSAAAPCDRWARILLLLHVASVAWLAAVAPWTTDEPNYLHAGIALRRQFEFAPYATILHGPLPFLANQLGAIAGAPLEPLVEYRFWGRLGMLPFTWVAAWSLWRFARELSGSRVALAALLLHATNPVVLAHAPLMTADMALTAGWTLCVWLGWRWLSAPSLPRLLLVGLAIGATLATKFLALFLLPSLGLALVVAAIRGHRAGLLWSRRSAGLAARLGDAVAAALLAGAVAWFALWSCYLWSPPGYETVVREVPAAGVDAQDPDAGVISRSFRELAGMPGAPELLALLPAPFVRGLDYQKHYSEAGGRSLLFDRAGSGCVEYYAVAFALKLPLAFLLLLALGLFVREPRWPRHAGTLVASAALLLPIYLSGFTAMQIGIRYALPVLPLFALVAARPFARGALGTNAGLGLLALLLALQAIAIWPRFLGWTNALAGGQAHRIFYDSNVDWPADWSPAADRVALLARHPDAQPVYAGSGPRFGKVVAHSFVCGRIDPRDPHRLHHWLRDFEPRDREGAWLLFEPDEAAWRALAGDDRRRAELAVAYLGAGRLADARPLLLDNADPVVPEALRLLDLLERGETMAPVTAKQWQEVGRDDRVLAMGAAAPPAYRAWALRERGDHAAIAALLEPESARGDLDPIEGFYLAEALYKLRREAEALALLRRLEPPPEQALQHAEWRRNLVLMQREIAAVHRLEARVGALRVR